MQYVYCSKKNSVVYIYNNNLQLNIIKTNHSFPQFHWYIQRIMEFKKQLAFGLKNRHLVGIN